MEVFKCWTENHGSPDLMKLAMWAETKLNDEAARKETIGITATPDGSIHEYGDPVFYVVDITTGTRMNENATMIFTLNTDECTISEFIEAALCDDDLSQDVSVPLQSIKPIEEFDCVRDSEIFENAEHAIYCDPVRNPNYCRDVANIDGTRIR